jgi:hypothetical protein
VRTVADVLGHKSALTTMGTYAHVMPGAQEQAVERIADRLNATAPSTATILPPSQVALHEKPRRSRVKPMG